MKLLHAILIILLDTIKSLGYIVIGVITISLSIIKGVFYKFFYFLKYLFFSVFTSLRDLFVFGINLIITLIKFPRVFILNLFSSNKTFSNKNRMVIPYKPILSFTEVVIDYSIVFLLFTRLKHSISLFILFMKRFILYCVKRAYKLFIFPVIFIVRKFLFTLYKSPHILKDKKKYKVLNLNTSSKKKGFSFFSFIFGIVFCIVFFMIPFEVYLWFRELPKPELLIIEGGKKPTRILDKNGKLLYEIYVDKKFDPVSLDKIPPYVINATLAVEDSEFYNHAGIRVDRILKAAKKTVIDGETQGASTITQQLIKNVLLTPERTVSRKIKELVLTFFVESKYTKDQILELYLNNISYGGVAWGIQSASQKYFGKNVWELNLAEASMLAGLPSAPSAFSPLVDIDLAKQRQLHVLNRMSDLGYITKTELVKAYDEKLIFADQKDYIRAPHFVQLVRNNLENLYGKREVEYGGFTVTTTLDLELQNEMEKVVKEEVDKDKNLNLTNGASVVLDVTTGGIVGYVGSIDYFRDGWGAFDVASSYRQPGSSIKPITYAIALDHGFTPATIVKDEKISYSQASGYTYTPVNYDGKFHGDTNLRSALANSYNIPAVKLANSVGPDSIVATGKSMGLTNWNADGNYGLSITLGGKEVKLLDHTNVYATFARSGVHKDTTPFISIKDSKGYELYKDNRTENQTISKESAYLIWDILSDNNARVPAFGTNNYLSIPNHKVAVKTGTTDNKRDNWTMGFTPRYVVGVWVGNNDNTPMSPSLASGLTGAAPIWNRITSYLVLNLPNEVPSMPDTVFKKYDEKCNRSELFIKGSNIPQSLCPVKTNDDKDTKEDNDD